MPTLKIIALEPSELPVLSAHLQDAVVKVGDMSASARDKRFALLCNRFDWQAELGDPARRERRRAALRVDRVTRVQSQGFDPRDPAVVLSVLALTFTPDADAGMAPCGTVTIICAGGATIRLDVECPEVALEDLGPAWQAAAVPRHTER